MATKEEVKGFFDGVTAKRKVRHILPVGEENGAPPRDCYLMRFTNPRTGVSQNENTAGSPYMSFQAEVVQPENFAGRKLRCFMGIFNKGDDENLAYNVQQIGGDDVLDGLPDDAGEAFAQLATRLDGEEFVGRIYVGYNKKEEREEVRIGDYMPASDWLALREEADASW